MELSENILKLSPNTTCIFNGGDPLEGCPKSYEEADSWADTANEDKEDHAPWWSFDCGFKLDFDGPLLHVNSRFYPPKTHYGPKWDGTVSIYLLDDIIQEKEFECDSLDELRESIEFFVQSFANQLKPLLLNLVKGG